jgi:hypothetical protein
MSRLMRMAYGHGGTRLERIRVAAPPPGSSAAPRWLWLLLLAVWLVIPILVSRYAVPTAPQQTTVIDASRLEVVPPPVIPEVKPVEQPPPQPPPVPAQSAQKPPERPTEDAPSPTITRPVARAPEVVDYQPRIVRERARSGMEAETPAVSHVRRAAATAETPAEKTTITRTRGAAAADAPGATERVAPLRRATVSEGPKAEAGASVQPITRKQRPSAMETGSAPRVTASRERGTVSGSAEGTGSSSLAVSRGVSFASLDICASPREQEEKITAVLGIVGERSTCNDGSGRYDFKGTQRISSFGLIIYPAKGRRPTNRCEELENAYRCLKTR